MAVKAKDETVKAAEEIFGADSEEAKAERSSNNEEGWVTVSGGDQHDAWNFDDKPVIQGLYIRKRSNVGPNSSMMYYIQESGENGETWGVWGSTALDSDMAQVPEDGAVEVRIEYLGFKKNPNTGRRFKSWDVKYQKVGA